MITLNLLPEVKKEFLRSQKARAKTITISILVSVASLGVLTMLAVYVYGGQLVIMNLQNGDIAKKSNQLKSIKDIDKYLTIQNQLSQISSLHEQKSIMSRVLSFLPALNPAAPRSVSLTSLDVDAPTNRITIKGTTASYEALTTFRDTLAGANVNFSLSGEAVTRQLFSEVSIDSGVFSASDGSKVLFTMTLTYDKDAMISHALNPQIVVTPGETTQSVVNVPLFEGGSN
jgi:Tfp pilus assembly protein PilN